MNRTFLPAILASLLFASCASEPGVVTPVYTPEPGSAETVETPRAFVITSHKNSAAGGNIPEWTAAWLESGVRGIENLDAYRDRYVFVSQSAGDNFNAMNLRIEGFSPELDFPRMAALRIEARLSAGVPHPDMVYGAFFETLIRAASDAEWSGMTQEDSFWIRRKFDAAEDEPEKEEWLFLILVSIEKARFESQLDSILENLEVNPPPPAEQEVSITRVKERFFSGF